ncbi:MAG: hypothetical protein GKR94_22160 [Gammaproteobacteria bacterium]|nr:hypothetical protein [Gammaproteobacteria bacterium]
MVLKRVTRLYRNTTAEWIKLSWVENGERKALISTPGHYFPDEFGAFRTIDEMVKNDRATVVLASGVLVQVTAERIVYSAKTAHLFERAEQAQAVVSGNLALKPQTVGGWQAYNFEVEDFHTYIAEGVRVHNDSGFFGAIGNTIDTALDKLGTIGDTVGDVIGGAFHAAGHLVSGAVNAVRSVTAGFGGAVANLAGGNIVSAIGSVATGVVGAVGSVVSGVAGAVGSFVGA